MTAAAAAHMLRHGCEDAFRKRWQLASDRAMSWVGIDAVVNVASYSNAAIARLSALVADDMARVDEAIVERAHSSTPLIPRLAKRLIAVGGKRLRPMMTLATARLCGYDGLDHIKLAACVELIHTATLLHDDVVDGSDLRRGQASANALFGNKPSVLVGDFLFSRSFELMVEVGDLAVLKTLSHASAVIAEGEVAQLNTINNLGVDQAACLDVVRAKTAALFAAAARVGGQVANCCAADAQALHDYGMGLGIAFQLVDDCLDFSANQQRLGKTVGDDFREGRVTLPIIFSYQRGDAEEKAFWKRVIEDVHQTDSDLSQAMDFMSAHGALEATLERAHTYGESAKKSLQAFQANEVRDILTEVVDFCIDRAY